VILDRPNRAQMGVFSLARRSPTGHDADYLAWHLLDHQPEQYRIDGVLKGQRWVSTPACRAARRPCSGPAAARFDGVDHVTHYLFGRPVGAPGDSPLDDALDDFLALGAELAGLDRYPARLPSVMLANFEVESVAAAPRVRVSPEAIPFRPHRGVYLVLEPPAPRDPPGERAQDLAGLVAVDGVAGAWRFAPGTRRPDRFDAAGLAVTLCYLDGDPAAVAPALAQAFEGWWRRSGVEPALAAPFETVSVPWPGGPLPGPGGPGPSGSDPIG
jgi:hypothetical protein